MRTFAPAASSKEVDILLFTVVQMVSNTAQGPCYTYLAPQVYTETRPGDTQTHIAQMYRISQCLVYRSNTYHNTCFNWKEY
jgi:hypothetical protein